MMSSFSSLLTCTVAAKNSCQSIMPVIPRRTGGTSLCAAPFVHMLMGDLRHTPYRRPSLQALHGSRLFFCHGWCLRHQLRSLYDRCKPCTSAILSCQLLRLGGELRRQQCWCCSFNTCVAAPFLFITQLVNEMRCTTLNAAGSKMANATCLLTALRWIGMQVFLYLNLGPNFR